MLDSAGSLSSLQAMLGDEAEASLEIFAWFYLRNASWFQHLSKQQKVHVASYHRHHTIGLCSTKVDNGLGHVCKHNSKSQ